MAASSNIVPHLKLTPEDSGRALRETSSSLSKMLVAQRQAIKELTQINQLRSTLKNSVIDQIKTNLSQLKQADELIKNRGTQAELDRIINHLTLNPHQDIIHLTDAVAKEVIAASDHRLQLLARLATKNAKDGRGDIQKNLADSIKQDPQAKLAFKLIESKQIDGVDSNQIRESLKQASLIESSGRPRISGVNKLVEDGLSTTLLTRSSITKNDARQIIDKLAARYQPTLSAAERDQLSESVVINSAILDQNAQVAELRAQLATDQIDAKTLSERLNQRRVSASDLINESYESSDSSKSPINLDLNNVRLISRLVENPELLNNPSTYQELLGMPRFSPSELVQKWRTFFHPETGPSIVTSGTQPSSFLFEIPTTTQTWFKTAGSQAQVVTRNFLDSIRSFFSDMGGGGSSGFGNFLKSGSSTVGNGLKSAGRSLGTGAKALGKSILGGAKALGGKFAAAAAAAAPEILAAIGITALVAVVIIGLIVVLQWFTNGSYKKSSSNVTPVGGVGGSTGGGGGYCDPSLTPETCTPLFCEGTCLCPAIGAITQGPGGGYSHVGFNAIDIGINNGDPIFSISNGTVSFADFSTVGYGNLVIVDNADGTQLYYAHLEMYFVKVGQNVVSGEQIGIGDNTGNSTGPHLHIEYKGPGAQNILNLFNFSENEKVVLEGCSNQTEGSPNCGGISCQK